jgi:hypothetical protein
MPQCGRQFHYLRDNCFHDEVATRMAHLPAALKGLDMTLAASPVDFRSPKKIYQYDAVMSGVTGIGLVFAATTLADFVDWPSVAGFLNALGAFLLSWALFNYAIGTGAGPGRSTVWINIVGDSLWVVLSVFLLITHAAQMNLFGQIAMGLQALLVLGVMTLKLRGASALLKA